MAELKELLNPELKRIDFESGRFIANNTLYQIEQSLTIERYCELQVLEKELGYGVNFKQMYERFQKVYDLINKQKFADAAVHINDFMRGLAQVQEREPVVLKICALFINYEGEDRTAFSQDMYTKKLGDWKAEGIDMRDFFRVASGSVAGYLEVYNSITRIISANKS